MNRKIDFTSKLIVLLAIILVLELIPLAAKVRMNIIYADDWGLGYGKEGQQPTGKATAEFLKQYDAYYVGSPKEKTVYLTFDAGYENGYTESILDTLKKHNVPAAFFLVGHFLEEEPDLVKRMVDEGHIVGNHTYSHPDMTAISDMDKFKKQLEDFEVLYKETTGQDLKKYYRPPSGKYNEDNLKNAQTLGYKTIFWSLAYVDWKNDAQPTREYAFSKLLPRMHPGAILLLHSTSKINSEILDELITVLEKDGYTFKSLDDLIQEN